MSVTNKSKVLRDKCNSKKNIFLVNGRQAGLDSEKYSLRKILGDRKAKAETFREKTLRLNTNAMWIKGFVTYQNGYISK